MYFLLCLHTVFYIALCGAEGDQLRIVGGHEAEPHSRPYMASLQDGTLHMCGGALIREDFVLTAAHCQGFRNYKIVLGAHSLDEQETSQQVFTDLSFFPHKAYNYTNNDIMLIKLNGKAKLSSAVQVIPMMNKKLREGKECSVAGWGDIGDNDTFPDTLREVKTTIVNRKTCDQQHKRIEITNRLVCATGQKKYQGFCTADSGGPLVCDRMVAGVVSFSGRRCGDPRTPDVYTRVISYKRWIANILKKNK
ncbi:hypothetical protein MATL_G00029630 [Megalops atlanticus]|uniref:Granzyme M n=1 Tax=Megalops atlanticus TaxID=7932 RepID=A0A9D3QEP6_MEGAT|nr:hypothetical protein MATL_G00029630 [Megalops atlanticus]